MRHLLEFLAFKRASFLFNLDEEFPSALFASYSYFILLGALILSIKDSSARRCAAETLKREDERPMILPRRLDDDDDE